MLAVFLCNCPDDAVETPWTRKPLEPPLDEQFVKFNVDGRDVALYDTYSRRSFRSRWGAYAEDRVTSWRPILHDVANAR